MKNQGVFNKDLFRSVAEAIYKEGVNIGRIAELSGNEPKDFKDSLSSQTVDIFFEETYDA